MAVFLVGQRTSKRPSCVEGTVGARRQSRETSLLRESVGGASIPEKGE